MRRFVGAMCRKTRLGMLLALLCGGVLLPATGGVLAASPVAVVEDVSGIGAGVAPLDFLRQGERIVIPSGTRITLGYFASCVREVIAGGSVVVGAEGSEIAGGEFSREVLKCPKPIHLDQVTVATTAAVPKLLFRGERKGRPAMVIFYTAPVISLKNPGEVIVERVDREETPRVFNVDGPFLDLAKQQVYLSAGGIYRLSAGGRELLFQVSIEAFEGGGPLLARLLRM